MLCGLNERRFFWFVVSSGMNARSSGKGRLKRVVGLGLGKTLTLEVIVQCRAKYEKERFWGTCLSIVQL